jgi:hypothetical protein
LAPIQGVACLWAFHWTEGLENEKLKRR